MRLLSSLVLTRSKVEEEVSSPHVIMLLVCLESGPQCQFLKLGDVAPGILTVLLDSFQALEGFTPEQVGK